MDYSTNSTGTTRQPSEGKKLDRSLPAFYSPTNIPIGLVGEGTFEWAQPWVGRPTMWTLLHCLCSISGGFAPAMCTFELTLPVGTLEPSPASNSHQYSKSKNQDKWREFLTGQSGGFRPNVCILFNSLYSNTFIFGHHKEFYDQGISAFIAIGKKLD